MDDNGLTAAPEPGDESSSLDRLPIEQAWGMRLLADSPDDHLSGSALAELASQGQSQPDYSARMEHIVRCAECRRLLKEIRATARAAMDAPAELPLPSTLHPAPTQPGGPAPGQAPGTASNSSLDKSGRGWFSFKFSLPNLLLGGGFGAVVTAMILMVLRPEPVPLAVPTPSPTRVATITPHPVSTPTLASLEVVRTKALLAEKERQLQDLRKKQKEQSALLTALLEKSPQNRTPAREMNTSQLIEALGKQHQAALARVRELEQRSPLPRSSEPQWVINERDVEAAATVFTATSLPNALKDLRTKGVATLGSEPGTPSLPIIQPLSGFGSYVRDGRPVLRWQAVKGATLYKVEIGDPDGADIKPPQTTDRSQFQPAEPLLRGRTYQWKVTAYDGKGKPSLPADKGWGRPLARTEWLLFKVMSEEQVRNVDKAAEKEKGARLVEARIFAQHGLLDDAETNLSALFKDLHRPDNIENARKVRKAAQQLQDVIASQRKWTTEVSLEKESESGGKQP